MRSSPRGSRIAALALAVLTGSEAAAHRQDEYLQAARLAIDPDRVEIALDLTPGVAVADRVLAEIDLDGSRSISAGEAHDYCGRVLAGMSVDLDGTPLVFALTAVSAPDAAAVRQGQGTIRMHAAAALPRLSPGRHALRYRTRHRADIGASLVNALVPASSRVTIGSQRRDERQRDVTIEYVLHADATTRALGGLTVATAALLIWLASWWRRARYPAVNRQA